MMESTSLWQMLLNIDKYLAPLAEIYGVFLFVILFLIIFAETGLVIFPFLPGDSLLFVAGAMTATGVVSAWILILILMTAAILGNTLNFYCGAWVGSHWLEGRDNWLGRLVDKKALEKTQNFYQKYGGITLVLSRFLPVFRTFAPFVAGMAKMSVRPFQFYNVIGALLWVAGLVTLGYFFGHIPFIRDHLHTIVLIGLLSAVVPVIFGVVVRWYFVWRR